MSAKFRYSFLGTDRVNISRSGMTYHCKTLEVDFDFRLHLVWRKKNFKENIFQEKTQLYNNFPFFCFFTKKVMEKKMEVKGIEWMVGEKKKGKEYGG